jgi:hypothetical protein
MLLVSALCLGVYKHFISLCQSLGVDTILLIQKQTEIVQGKQGKPNLSLCLSASDLTFFLFRSYPVLIPVSR